MLFGSIRESSSTWPVGQFDYGATPIQTSNFSWTEPNAYITNTFNKLIFTQSSARFLFFSCALFFYLLEQNMGRAGRYVFLLLRKHGISLLDVHKALLYAMFRIWKRWECIRLENRQFGGVLRVMFLTENDKINESWKNRRNDRTERGTVMFHWE